jgi:predicted DNA-binding transcriptional regulator YafY
MVRPQWARLAYIARRVRRGPFSIRDVQREFGVSHKTAQRDIDILRDDLQWPIFYHRQSHRWHLTGEPPQSL